MRDPIMATSPDERQIGWGVIGTGAIVQTGIAPAINSHSNSQLQAVLSRDRQRAERFARRFGASASYTTLEDFLADPMVDAVFIASPNALHPEQALAAVESAKHVLVEKPMVLDSSAGLSLVRAAVSRNVLIGVGFHLRHKPSAVAVRQLLGAGEVGAVRFVHIEIAPATTAFLLQPWRSQIDLVGGGTVINQATHAIDLVRFLTGQEIIKVNAFVDKYPLEDVFGATCVLESGALATLSSQQVVGGSRTDYQVICDDGWLRVRNGTAASPGEQVDIHPQSTRRVPGSDNSAYWYEIDAFARAVLDGKAVSGDGIDGLRNVGVVQAIYQAVQEGKSIDVEWSEP